MKFSIDGWFHTNPHKETEKTAPPIKIMERLVDINTPENTIRIEDDDCTK